MNKKFSRHFQYRRKRKKHDTAELAAQLAPLEEQDKHAAQKQGANERISSNGANREPGAIVVDNASLSLPKGLIEVHEENRFLGIEPVVLVILSVMLAFITFIAWQISLMPPE